MIKSFSQVSAFQKQIIEINRASAGFVKGYYWKRRSDHVIYLYCDGKIIGESKSTTNLIQMVKNHAVGRGEWFTPEPIEHYISHVNGIYRLYVGGKYCKKSHNKESLDLYVEVTSWLEQSGLGSSWGKR